MKQWSMPIFVADEEAWKKLVQDIVGSGNPESVTLDGEPGCYPCYIKWAFTPGVYKEVTVCFFYPEEALDMLRQSGHMIRDDDLTKEQREEIRKTLETGEPPEFLKRDA